MKKENGVYFIENEECLDFSVQKSKVSIRDAQGVHEKPDEVAFIVENLDVDNDLVEGLLMIHLTQKEAKKLAEALLKIV